MNKTELIAAVAEKSGISKKDAEKAVAAALSTITEALKAGEKVQLVGFGVFEVRERPLSRLVKRSRKHSTNYSVT